MNRYSSLALALVLAAGPLQAGENVATTFILLVGHPDQPSSAVTMIPGTIIPDNSKASVTDTLERSQVLAGLSGQLKSTMRLGRVEVRYEQKLSLPVGGAAIDLPAPNSRSSFVPRVRAIEADGDHATYRVEFLQGGKTVKEMPVSVSRGQRSVVGMLDGPDAPYLFLVIEPAPSSSRAGAAAEARPATSPPRLVSRVNPVYPRDAGDLEGSVVLEVSIGTDGKVGNIKVLSGLHPAYDGAAVDAVRQWVFEPALDGGKPVEVRYTLTIRFVGEKPQP